MNTPTDKRLFAMCLVSASIGLITYAAVGTDYGSGLILLIAIAVLAVLMIADGYLQSS